MLSITLVLGFTSLGNATLWDRGGGLIYDDYFNITWLQDANYAETSGYDEDGQMNWQAALGWVQQLEYRGYRDWYLPDIDHYFHLHQNFHYIGETLYAAPFASVQPSYYWTSQEYHPGDETIPQIYAWAYSFQLYGGYSEMGKLSTFYAWAVRHGDVTPIPEPDTMILFGSSLLGLAGSRRKFKK